MARSVEPRRQRSCPLGPRLAAVSAGLFVVLLQAGCEGTIDRIPFPCDLTYALLDALRVDGATFPEPAVAGTVFEISGESFVDEPNCVVPEVELNGWTEGERRWATLRPEVHGVNDIWAWLEPEAADRLGPDGVFDGDLVVRYRSIDGGRTFDASAPVALRLARELVPRVSAIHGRQVYLEDRVMIEGEGFLSRSEGTTELVADGVFVEESGASHAVDEVSTPASLLVSDDRRRAVFRWTPEIAGLHPGRFEGTLTPINVHEPSGRRLVGHALEVEIRQERSVLFDITPRVASLGQIVTFVGRGLVGSPGGGDALTTLHLEGTFAPDGGRPEPFERDLVGRWIDGGAIQFDLTVTSTGSFLRSVEFDAQRGVFEGTIVPVMTSGRDRVEGLGFDATFELGPVRQVCWVRFLPGFSDSLEEFGLGAVEQEIRARVVRRMTEIYQPPERPEDWVNVEFRAEEPDDFYSGGYAIVDIGGPDPNALGLFGYDSSPDKDVGNLRLHDHVGGANALGALDGHGYGGVFIESMLYWSSRPPPGPRPVAAPEPNPLFDQVFDAVREQEVVAGEWPTGAPADRLDEIELAIFVLSNIIADTAAHEFGHSLGLAQPYGSPLEYHNAVPRDGCLMDSGHDRPLEERGLIFGNPGARLCGENLWYLQELLPME